MITFKPLPTLTSVACVRTSIRPILAQTAEVLQTVGRQDTGIEKQ